MHRLLRQHYNQFSMMTMNLSVCPSCTSSWQSTQVVDANYAVLQCKRCRMARIDPIPSADELTKFYHTSYSLGAFADSIGMEKMPYYTDTIVRLIREFAPNAQEVCEVGCSSGSLLHALSGQGWRVHGYELADSTARVARNAGLNVITGEIPQGQQGAADVVILRHCLEHTRDISEQLKQIRNYLRPDGIFLMVVPNYGSSASRLFGRRWQWLNIPEHIWYFSPASAAAVLGRSQFTVERISTTRGDADCLPLHLLLDILRRFRFFLKLKRFVSGDIRAPRILARKRNPWIRGIERLLNFPWFPAQWAINRMQRGEELWVVARRCEAPSGQLDSGRSAG